jgi:PAS domain S-box-containing protein
LPRSRNSPNPERFRFDRVGRTRTGSRPVNPNIDDFSRTLAHEAPDAIVYADVGGMIRFWNRGAERVFGFPASEVLGKSLDMIIPESMRKRHWDAYLETTRTGKTRYGAGEVLAVPALRKDGTRVSIEFSTLPFRDRDGGMLGVAAIVRDVTKRFDEIEALRKELAALRTSHPDPSPS